MKKTSSKATQRVLLNKLEMQLVAVHKGDTAAAAKQIGIAVRKAKAIESRPHVQAVLLRKRGFVELVHQERAAAAAQLCKWTDAETPLVVIITSALVQLILHGRLFGTVEAGFFFDSSSEVFIPVQLETYTEISTIADECVTLVREEFGRIEIANFAAGAKGSNEWSRVIALSKFLRTSTGARN